MHLSRFVNGVILSLLIVSDMSANANVAWLKSNTIVIKPLSSTQKTSSLNAQSKVPLGSLWKLFIYIYLSDTHAQEEPYQCLATPNKDDRYCCPPGASVDRDKALAHSCTPYFDPNRLHISPKKWKIYWDSKTDLEWLSNIHQLKADTEVSLQDLLHALSIIPIQARNEARDALLETALELYGKNAWSDLGTAIRYKTYSWHTHDGKAFGGAAGWLADGTPFWFGAHGSSYTALTQWSKPLSQTLPVPSLLSTTTDDSCVDVAFFAQYPIKAIWNDQSKIISASGNLKGKYRLEFENGNWLTITTQGEMRFQKTSSNHYKIKGRFGLNNYIARVLNREANTTQPDAARALSIAARTYLIQNGIFENGCWKIADSSHTQRVSATIPTQKALETAYFTDDLILRGSTINYHSSIPGSNRMSWTHAYNQSQLGWSFDKILKHSYPKATLSTINGRLECVPLASAESWLQINITKWRSTLERETGFEPLESIPTVCRLNEGNPYSDQKRLRIYVRGWQSINDRLTLAHEYLHLVFRYHPNGINESYIEQLSRKLIGAAP